MTYWTNKHWGAVIGAALVVAIALVGAGLTALAVLAAIGGFLIGKFLDGELDLEEIQARAQDRFRRDERAEASVRAPGAGVQTDVGPPAADAAPGRPVGAQPPGASRVR